MYNTYCHLYWREDHPIGSLPILAVVVQGLQQQLWGGGAAKVQTNNLHTKTIRGVSTGDIIIDMGGGGGNMTAKEDSEKKRKWKVIM